MLKNIAAFAFFLSLWMPFSVSANVDDIGEQSNPADLPMNISHLDHKSDTAKTVTETLDMIERRMNELQARTESNSSSGAIQKARSALDAVSFKPKVDNFSAEHVLDSGMAS